MTAAGEQVAISSVTLILITALVTITFWKNIWTGYPIKTKKSQSRSEVFCRYNTALRKSKEGLLLEEACGLVISIHCKCKVYRALITDIIFIMTSVTIIMYIYNVC